MYFKYDQFMEGRFVHSPLIESIIYEVSFKFNDDFLNTYLKHLNFLLSIDFHGMFYKIIVKIQFDTLIISEKTINIFIFHLSLILSKIFYVDNKINLFLGIGKKKQPNHLRDFNEPFIRHGLITYKWGNITRSLKFRFHLHIICSLLGNLVRTTVYFETKCLLLCSPLPWNYLTFVLTHIIIKVYLLQLSYYLFLRTLKSDTIIFK